MRDQIKRMTKHGILKYGLQLCLVEVTTLGSIYVFKLMIDYLQAPEDFG